MGRDVWSVLLALAIGPGIAAQTRWSLATPQLQLSGACAAVYDSQAQRSLVYVSSTAQTWALSSTSGVWVSLHGSSGAPPFVSDPAVAWDASRQRLVMFGGRNFVGVALGGTWELDGSVWIPVAPAIAPPARYGAALGYDPVLDVTVLAGGETGALGSQVARADAWTWDGTDWTALTGVSPIGAATAAFDVARGELIVYAQNGTFAWHNGAFTLVASAAASPPARRRAAMVYDVARQRIVLYGGAAASGLSQSDVWEFDGVVWSQRQPGGVPPPPRAAHGMVFDPVLSVTRVVAGISTTLGSTSTTTTSLADERHYAPTYPAAALQLTPGCAASLPLAVSGLPWLGDTLTLSMPLAPGAPAALFAFGLAPLATPLPLASLGFPLCTLWVSPDLLVVAPLGPTGGEIVWTLPNVPVALGAQVLVQAVDFTAAKASDELLLLFGSR